MLNYNNVVTATVIADASFCHETFAAGWAVWVRVDNQPVMKYSGNFKKQLSSNNEAEFFAIMNGIYFAAQAGAKQILAQTDSLVIVQVKRPAYMLELLLLVEKRYNVVISFRHVKGHTKVVDARSHCQNWCDKMAKKAMRTQRKLNHAVSNTKNN